MKVLIAEDDLHTREGLGEVLASEGYEVTLACNGNEALEAFERVQPDFVCLDIMMPRLNGFDVCRQIRQQRPSVPIVFISAKGEEIDKVLGLELGADDFIVKPFGVKEVLARIRAVTRRCHASTVQPSEPFTLCDLQVFPAELRASRGAEEIELSLRDIKILEMFHSHAGQVLSRSMIFNECWGERYLPNSRTLDQHISQLRKRIEVDPKVPRIIRTMHGAGYCYQP